MIRILHLYHDLLDLYGDSGNLMAITAKLDRIGIKWKTDKLSLYDTIDFMKYDLVYIGVGKDSSLNIASEDFLKRRDSVLKAIKKGTLFLVTGNSQLLFGQYFTDSQGKRYEGIGLLPYYGTQSSQVFICDVLARYQDQEIYGFINRTSELFGEHDAPLFQIVSGKGYNNAETSNEGWHTHNYFGTWMLGPLLVKNPLLLEEMLKILLKEEYQKTELPYLLEAYDQTIADMHKKTH
ncbi:MAG: hypothetical protein IJI05_02160 [Erysipelotrichaceae bacterium]|nr:hypothetical protein [Erysipelotrichaceae bacterium]